MSRKLILFCIVIAGLYISCGDESVSSLKMGEDYVDGESGIVLIDTLSVELSTVQIDSIQTSNSGVALVGDYKNTILGNIKSEAICRIGLPSASILEDDVFDSITINLKHSNFYIGDTSQLYSLQVHELNTYIEDIDQTYFYNTTKVDSKDEILGQISYYPTPNKTDELEFKLNDDFGLELFNLFIEDADEVASESSFMEYFKGIVLKGDENLNKSVIGYAVNDSCLYLKMYYHRVENYKKEYEAVFNAESSNYQFNSYSVDRSSTLLSTLKSQDEEISSKKANNKSFIQGGTGLMTKVKFPGLANVFQLVLLDQIIKAELILVPTENAKSINDYDLPSSLLVYTTNNVNSLTSVLTASDGSTTLTMDLVQNYYDDKDKEYYSIDITQYVVNELLDGFFDPDFAFLVGLTSDDQKGSIKSLILGGENDAEYTPELKLYTYYY